ncbi:hypothetical protein COL922a_009956 [Colletotrichum nupharicola]|nr:hypothetical protein COL922a_009956 [Colletotrichum nupharicola]
MDDESDLGMIAVHANISKINHSCRPNAASHWDWALLSHKLWAVRDIAGEEITISYLDPIQTLRSRQHYSTSTLGFKCACSHCQAPLNLADLSDDRVNEIHLLQSYLETREITPAEPTAMAELLVSLYKQEGLDAYLCKAYAITAREWNAQNTSTKRAPAIWGQYIRAFDILQSQVGIMPDLCHKHSEVKQSGTDERAAKPGTGSGRSTVSV